MSPIYRHTQVGYLTLAGSLVVCALLYPMGLLAESTSVVGAVALSVLVFFSSLTVQLDSERLVCRFGPGPIRRRLPLSDIESVEVVRNHWHEGWGIRYRPRRGWM